MSHFTVAVIHNKNQNIEDLLEPYNENLDVEPYINRTKAEMIEQGYRTKQYVEENKGECIGSWAYKYLKAETDEDIWQVEKNEICCTYNENGDEFTTYNPDSKWDWWEVGGRFNGNIKLRNENDMYVNSAKIEDIDFSIDENEYNSHKRWYEVVVEGSEPQNEREKKWYTIYSTDYYKDKYSSADDFARRNSKFTTFAVVTPDGVWHEKGRMGWWGISNETGDESRDWDANYYDRFIAPYDPKGTYITIVDCHI